MTSSELVAGYLAAGIDPARATIFAHSLVPELNRLLLPFLSLVTLPELLRNPTVKDEASASGMKSLNGLTLTYPSIRQPTSFSARARSCRSAPTSSRRSSGPAPSCDGSTDGNGLAEVQAGKLRARGDLELGEHLAQVIIHRARAEEQLRCHLWVGHPGGHEAGDL